jgi:tetratricopeptide (TPR) repeat protein
VILALGIAGAVVVVGFSPAARLAARTLPRSPESLAPVVTGSQHANTTAVKAVPAGLPGGARIRTTADVFPYAEAALGRPDATALMSLLNSQSYLAESLVGYHSGHIAYPYRYPPMDSVLGSAPPASFASGATALAAALTVLAAQPEVDGQPGYMATQNAGPAAYAVLENVRAPGGCTPQLDLLLLLAADQLTSDATLGQEEQRTETACPHDPTPAWLAGQAQLRRLALVGSPTYIDTATTASLGSAIATFRRLAAGYPSDTGVLTGLGDAYLRAGTRLRLSEPFTARQDLRSAVAAYDRAAAAGGEYDVAPGLARALTGLGEPSEAARLLSPLASSAASPGPFLELLVMADETAHDFGGAAAAAQRLGTLGSGSYPDNSALLPVPSTGGAGSLDDASLPLSFGTGRLTPLTTALILKGGAGGSLQDLSFIPAYRDDTGLTGTQPDCPSWTWVRDELLLGHAAQALTGWQQFQSARPRGWCLQSDKLKLVAETLAGQQPDPGIMRSGSITSDGIADAWQNLLRWAGDLPAAARFTTQWQSARGDASALPALRLGEIDFLAHRYDAAAAEFGLAARRSRLIGWNNAVAFDQAELDRGSALLAAGRTTEATATLRPLDLDGTLGYSYQQSLPYSQQGDNGNAGMEFGAVSYYACEQLGDYESRTGDLHAAAEDYTNALNWAPVIELGTGVRPEVLNNNAALAHLGLGDTATAASLENKALAADPMDPVFLMTAGFIADRAGHIAQAIRNDRQALDSDPGAFPVANDLGVELARQHQDAAAEAALRQAVGASPGYALGWFNLGVLESRLGPAGLPASQGAFATAYSLDPALKDRQHQMTIDASVYRTALDLSRTLPPRWSLSQLPRPAPAAAAGLLAIVILGLGLARASGHGGAAIAAQWLDPLSGRLESAPLLKRLRHPGWALAGTALAFLLAELRRAPGLTESTVYITGVLILALAGVLARITLARRRGVIMTQETWPPALAFGLFTSALGLVWAPLPVIRSDGEDDPPVHLAAPVTLAALSAILFAETAWLHTPLTQSWAVAALIMSASTLLPVGPLDGARVGKAGILAATGVIAGALLVGLGIV